MGAGKGWSQEETSAACKAYVTASEDPRRGSGKKKEVFTAQVLEIYQNIVKSVVEENADGRSYPSRSGDAVMQRFRKARSESLKFEGIIASIKARNPTGGPTEEDIERAALAIYNGEGTLGTMYTYLRSCTTDVGPEFPFMEAFKYLQSTQTWKMVRESNSSCSATRPSASPIQSPVDVGADLTGAITGVNVEQEVVSGAQSVSSSQEPVITLDREEKKRPIGNKRSIDLANHVAALHKGADAIDKMAEASRKRTKIAEEALSIDRQKSLISLFSMADTDPNIRRRFLRLSQLQALAELEKNCDAAVVTSNDHVSSDPNNVPLPPLPLQHGSVPVLPQHVVYQAAASTNAVESACVDQVDGLPNLNSVGSAFPPNSATNFQNN